MLHVVDHRNVPLYQIVVIQSNYVTFLQKESKGNAVFAVMKSMGQEKEQPFIVKDAPLTSIYAQKPVLRPTINNNMVTNYKQPVVLPYDLNLLVYMLHLFMVYSYMYIL